MVARYAPEERFAELMAALAAERGKLRAALGDGDGGADRLCRGPGVPAGTTAEAADRRISARAGACDEARCARPPRRSPAAPHRPRARRVLGALVRDPGARRRCSAYIAAFLTDDGEIRKT